MRQITNRILATFLTTFFVLNVACGQTIKEDGKEVKLDPDTEKKVSMLVENLTGTWQLKRTKRIEGNETITQKPSIQLWLTPGAKPFTTIKIDSLRNFEIDQACMKCPNLFWKGQYEIEIRTSEGFGLFYLNFIENRQKKAKTKKQNEDFKLEFSGHIISFENGELIIKDKKGTEWCYVQQEN